MTNLNKDGLKDLIICDRCNENIIDVCFVRFENSFVYHVACVRDHLPDDVKFESENIVFPDFKGRS
jgi:hypothetical protein